MNEVYSPWVDQANIRDLGLLVTDGENFVCEEKRDTESVTVPIAQGVPAYVLANSCLQQRFRIRKTVLTDTRREVLLQRVEFTAVVGESSDYHVYALLAPHLGNHGAGNTGWVGEYKGTTMLFAERDGVALALAASRPFLAASCGYAGSASDGWQDLCAHFQLTHCYGRAEDGNLALTAELDVSGADPLVLALGFGSTPNEAAERVRASLLEPFDDLVEEYVRGWTDFQAGCLALPPVVKNGIDLYRLGTAVLRTHDAKEPPSALVASLSVPWGQSKGDDDLGGYHLIWPRDLVEAALAMLAAGQAAAARQTLLYLMSIQEADGHWAQNAWLDGTPYWPGVQMDETAFPILLADALRRHAHLEPALAWRGVRSAAAYLVQHGPVTGQDRWEEDGGYSPFTLAVEVVALLAAADFADAMVEPEVARYLRETADVWNDNIERWTFVTETALAQSLGIHGYYVRIAPPESADAASPAGGFVPIKNRPPGSASAPTDQIISPDALALVRFGLRAADDPRIVDTVRAIDSELRAATATGPIWHRYEGDGYGEHDDGSPFDGTGVGRGWPLLAGERAHYELASGNRGEAERLLLVMAAQSSLGGLIPEQVWEAGDITERELLNGHPSGSAMPLVWAHAEFISLCRSLADGAVFGMPPQPVQRYQRNNMRSPRVLWRFSHKLRSLSAGLDLRVEADTPYVLRWGTDDRAVRTDAASSPTGLGTHYVDLPTAALNPGAEVTFTFQRQATGFPEGEEFVVVVEPPIRA